MHSLLAFLYHCSISASVLLSLYTYNVSDFHKTKFIIFIFLKHMHNYYFKQYFHHNNLRIYLVIYENILITKTVKQRYWCFFPYFFRHISSSLVISSFVRLLINGHPF